MLDITTSNQQAPANISYCSYGMADDLDLAAELLDDDMMDPLFDEDWLHENNLDILFDLFEEEIESKIGTEPTSASSTLFGTSPITSYLFGTSPTLASTLDLLYLDNQQQANNNNNGPTLQQQQQQLHQQQQMQQLHQQQQMQQQQQSSTVAAAAAAVGIGNVTATGNPTISHNGNTKSTSTFIVGGGSKLSAARSHGGVQQVVGHQVAGASSISNSITNAMRIKRGLKKGQSEGISLLAKPLASNSVKANGSSRRSSNKHDNAANKASSKHNSDKTSAKITNFKNSIIIGNPTIISSNRNGIDINYSKQSQQQNQQAQQPKRERVYLHNCQRHIHQLTGRAVLHEHSYAVRGH